MNEQEIPADVMEKVEAELEEYFKDEPRTMGFCHVYWRAKKSRLKELGYDWKTPAEEHPDCLFD